jgi:Acetyltransferase (GNAT) domain
MAAPELTRYTGPAEPWDDFVATSNNGTIFHRLGYLAYHGGRFAANAHHLAWCKGDSIHAVMPLGIFEEEGRRVARSPFGASYGGVVAKRDLSLAQASDYADSLLDHLRAEGVDRLVVTPAPGLNHEHATDYVEFFLLKAGAVCTRFELTSYIHVQEEPLDGFRHAAVKAIRKAQANDVRVEENDRLEEFYEILAANRRKYDATPTHSLDELRWLRKRFPDDIRLFMAYREGVAIGGSLVYRVNPRVLLDFYWAHVDEFQGLRPVSLLVHEIARWAHGEGIRTFDFGTQTIDMVPVEGGTRFKETFGALGVFRRTYQIDLR